MKNIVMFIFLLTSISSIGQLQAIDDGIISFTKIIKSIGKSKKPPKIPPVHLNPHYFKNNNPYGYYRENELLQKWKELRESQNVIHSRIIVPEHKPSYSNFSPDFTKYLKEKYGDFDKSHYTKMFTDKAYIGEDYVYEENIRAIEAVEIEFGSKPIFAIERSKYNVRSQIFQTILEYQIKNDVPILNEARGDLDAKFKISQEGVEKFKDEVFRLKSKISFAKNISELSNTSSPLNLFDFYLTDQLYHNEFKFSNDLYKLFVLEPDQVLDRKIKSTPSLKNNAEGQKKLVENVKKQNEIYVANLNMYEELLEFNPQLEEYINSGDFQKINDIINDEIRKTLDIVDKTESALYEMGYINNDLTKFSIDNKEELNQTFEALSERFKKAISAFMEEFEISGENLPFEKMNQLILKQKEQSLSEISKIIYEAEGLSSKQKIEEFFSIHPELNTNLIDNQKLVVSKNFRLKTKQDINSNNYYIKSNGNYRKFYKEDVDIKNHLGDSIISKQLIKIIPNSKVFIEITNDLVNKVETIENFLARNYNKEEIKVVYLSKHKTNKELKRDKNIVDSIKKVFPKRTLRVLKNKGSEIVKKSIRRQFKRNRGKTLFLLGHIENGAFRAVEESNYNIPLSFIHEISNEYDCNYFIGGCSSAFYNVPGTTDIINNLNFSLAVANSKIQNNTYQNFIGDISNHPIAAGQNEVKIILDPDSFVKNKIPKANFFLKIKGIWHKYYELFFGLKN